MINYEMLLIISPLIILVSVISKYKDSFLKSWVTGNKLLYLFVCNYNIIFSIKQNFPIFYTV